MEIKAVDVAENLQQAEWQSAFWALVHGVCRQQPVLSVLLQPCNKQKKHCRYSHLPAVSSGTAESASIMKHKGKELAWLISEQEISPPKITCLLLSPKSRA